MATATGLASAAVSSLTSIASSMASSTASPTSAPLDPTMTSPAPSPSPTNGGNGEDNGSTGKPLLFFVALGFGVVFTNLWIIVGVKYCFRYNQRARQGVLRDENGDPIDLNNMPRPRRRKEKKLMSMEEVNERFPLVKYKTWRATREQEGLPAEGGVNISASRAASIKEPENQDATSPELPRASSSANAADALSAPPKTSVEAQRSAASQTRDFADSNPPRPSGDHTKPSTQADQTTALHEKQQGPAATVDNSENRPVAPVASESPEDDDEDDPIRTAVPAELLAAPGDACAICIDTLEDDDEVRGLSCGHAFHAGCLDPWLTSRRACCPLCKADYYVPKPRPEGEATNEGANDRRDGRSPTVPHPVWIGGRNSSLRPQIFFSSGARFSVGRRDRYGFPILTRSVRNQQLPAEQSAEQGEPHVQPPQPSSWASRLSSRVRSIPLHPPLRLGNRSRQTTPSPGQTAEDPSPTTTPSQLEAGTTSR